MLQDYFPMTVRYKVTGIEIVGVAKHHVVWPWAISLRWRGGG